jgi:hypothetical protein
MINPCETDGKKTSFVSIGCPGRPFVTEDPALDDLFPVDDEAWDKGVCCFLLGQGICVGC